MLSHQQLCKYHIITMIGFKEVDIDEWIALGRIDAALKNDRMLDTSLSIVARSDDVE